MKKLLLLPIMLAGCATNYDAYVEANIKVAQAKAQAESEKYKAMAAIAASGDSAAKVAAVMSMALGSQNQQQQQQIAPPKSAADTTLQAIATILPSIAQIYGINRQVALGIEQSRNTMAIGRSTNDTFANIAGRIQAPAANVSTTTTTTTNTRDSNNSTDNTRSYTNSHNTTDSTHTPTVIKIDPTIVNPVVVKPEAPVIVKPEAPVIVKPEVVNPVVVKTDPPPAD